MKMREVQGGMRLPLEMVPARRSLKLSARCALLLASVSSFSSMVSSAWADDGASQPVGETKIFTSAQGKMVPYIDSITDDGNKLVSVVQNGPGTTLLASANSYTGSTTISPRYACFRDRRKH